MKIADGSSSLLSEDLTASEPFWISDAEIAYLKASDNGCTTLMYQDVHDPFKYVAHTDLLLTRLCNTNLRAFSTGST